MSKVSTNITIDSDVKSAAQKLFSDLGMDLSTAVNVFLKQAVRNNGIPFEISRDVPNETTRAAIIAAENGEDMYGPFDSVADLMEALNA